MAEQMAVMVDRSPSGTYEIVGEREDWADVVANVREAERRGTLWGWGPYSQVYLVKTRHNRYWYFVED